MQHCLIKTEYSYKHLLKQKLSYAKKLLSAKRIIKRLQKTIYSTTAFSAGIKKVLDESQIKLLSGEFQKVPLWCNETIQKALKLKFVPLPSLRTLNRRLQSIKFNSGILHEIIYFLSIKV